MKAALFRKINGRFLLIELGDTTLLLKEIRIYMRYPNLKHFSLFNFQIVRLILYYYNLVLEVSLEACRRSICLMFH